MDRNVVEPHSRSRGSAFLNLLVVLAALCVSTFVGAVQAQVPGEMRQGPPAGAGEIRGVVVEAETLAPVPAASVGVWSRAESALVAGAITRQDGSFRIEGLQRGTYHLRVSVIGFDSYTSDDLTIGEGAERLTLERIQLTRSAVAVEGVEVSVDRPMMAISPDRNTYRAKDVAPTATNATEILEAVPSVQVDGDGKVSLRGNENVAVQINGRPTPIRGDQLAAYLRQLPANTIDRVEVIPNPSARHDPEGMAGIINIVLRQNVDLGTSGGLTLSGSPANRHSFAGNLGHQQGNVTTFFTYGFNTDERRVIGINDRTRFGPTLSPRDYTEQDIDGTESNGGHNASATVDYRLSQRDVLSNALMFNLRGSTNESLAAYSELDGGRALQARYDRTRDSDSDSWMVDYTLALKRTLEPQRHELSAELRANRSGDEDRTTLWRQPLGGNGEPVGGPLDTEINGTDARTSQLTAQVDYTRSLAERTKLETGYKGNARWIDRDFRVLEDLQGTGQWVPGELSNALELDERVNAVYAVLSHGAGKAQLQAGLRAEYASRDFSLATSGETFPHSYTSLFPSGLISYNLSEQSQVKLSYSRRIRRPGTFELNPFPVFFDQQNVFLGNPELDPEYTDAVELGLQRTGKLGSVQVSPFYRRTSNIIRIILNTADTVAGREVTSVSFQNLDTGTSWGTDVNGSLRIGRKFNGLAGLNLFKMVTDGSGDSSLSSDAVTWSTRVNGTYNVTPKTAVQAMYFYRAPMNIERGRFSAFSMTNLSVRHQLRGDKATVTLRVTDPFDTMRFQVRAGDDNVLQLTEREFDSRTVHLSVQLRFGQAPRIRQPRPDANAEGGGPGFP